MNLPRNAGLLAEIAATVGLAVGAVVVFIEPHFRDVHADAAKKRQVEADSKAAAASLLGNPAPSIKVRPARSTEGNQDSTLRFPPASGRQLLYVGTGRCSPCNILATQLAHEASSIRQGGLGIWVVAPDTTDALLETFARTQEVEEVVPVRGDSLLLLYHIHKLPFLIYTDAHAVRAVRVGVSPGFDIESWLRTIETSQSRTS